MKEYVSSYTEKDAEGLSGDAHVLSAQRFMQASYDASDSESGSSNDSLPSLMSAPHDKNTDGMMDSYHCCDTRAGQSSGKCTNYIPLLICVEKGDFDLSKMDLTRGSQGSNDDSSTCSYGAQNLPELEDRNKVCVHESMGFPNSQILVEKNMDSPDHFVTLTSDDVENNKGTILSVSRGTPHSHVLAFLVGKEQAS